MTKYIFVTGGVVSGLGKGITAASLGRLLKARGIRVAAQKLDPYINTDPGTMSPYQHGEVYVTEDGAETDLDLGHYERFIDEDLNRYSNLTTGKVYANVIQKERQGGYLGSTVQTIPHITDEIRRFIYRVGEKTGAEVVITEIGGTIGDIESQPFIEAIRQVGLEAGRENTLYIHVTLVPYLKASGEHKSKPTQHSVKELQGMGISPNIIVLRADEKIQDESIFSKIAHFCNVKEDCVIENTTLPTLYAAPLMLEKAGLAAVVCRELGLKSLAPDLKDWENLVERIGHETRQVKIGLVGKYVQLHDAYLSVAEALRHAGYAQDVKVEIEWIDSEELTEKTAEEILSPLQGIIVPGGFGGRGIEGMILAAKYARERQMPYFGICLGMQVAVIEFARNAAGLAGANSREFDENAPYRVIDFMPGQNDEIDKGGTLRLGKYPCELREGTVIADCYGTTRISNPRERLLCGGSVPSGVQEPTQSAASAVPGLYPRGAGEEIRQDGRKSGRTLSPKQQTRPRKGRAVFERTLRRKGLLKQAGAVSGGFGFRRRRRPVRSRYPSAGPAAALRPPDRRRRSPPGYSRYSGWPPSCGTRDRA